MNWDNITSQQPEGKRHRGSPLAVYPRGRSVGPRSRRPSEAGLVAAARKKAAQPWSRTEPPPPARPPARREGEVARAPERPTSAVPPRVSPRLCCGLRGGGAGGRLAQTLASWAGVRQLFFAPRRGHARLQLRGPPHAAEGQCVAPGLLQVDPETLAYGQLPIDVVLHFRSSWVGASWVWGAWLLPLPAVREFPLRWLWAFTFNKLFQTL